jgi:HAD superfamily hydrolase (TIGR01509 family)
VIKGVIFDLDGVMIRSEPLALEAWQRCLAPDGKRMEDEEYRSLIGVSHEASLREVIGRHHLSMALGELDRCFWAHMLDLVEQAEQMPGLLPLLQDLRTRGYGLAIASNSSSEYVRKAIARNGIAEYFLWMVGADQVERGKPAPDVYLAAARGLGVPPESCLAVEDSPSGVQAALAAGMACVFIPNSDLTPVSPNGANVVYPSLEAWHADLDRLLPSDPK